MNVAGLGGGVIDDTIDESDVLKDKLGAAEDVDIMLDREAAGSVFEGDIDWAGLDWPKEPEIGLDMVMVAEELETDLEDENPELV